MLGQGEAKTRIWLPMRLSNTATTAAVREAIVRNVLSKRPKNSEDLRVVGDGADMGSDTCREIAVFGRRDLLEQISAAKPKSLAILSFGLASNSEVKLLTRTPLEESAVRSRLNEGGVLTQLVRSVIPRGAEAGEFVIAMHELSEEKAVEQVRDDLLLAFQDKLKHERVLASLHAAEQKPDVANVDQLARDGYKFFVLKLDPAMPLQAIQSTLLRAGYKDAMLKSEFSAREAAAVRDSLELKLKGDAEALEEASERIALAFANPDPFRSIETIGPKVAEEMKNKAVLAVFLSCVAIIFYIWFRFGEVKFGLAAVTALVHDVLLTAGAVGVADALSGTALGAALGFSDIKINVTMIAAFLTLIGYSINDTIVVFDRIRENLGGAKSRITPALVDASINQILSRTLLTSLTTFMVLMVLYIVGGPVIHGFAFVMAFGVLVGTYSSIFIASPILIGWENFIQAVRTSLRTITFRAAVEKTSRRRS